MIFELKQKKDNELASMYKQAMEELDSFYKLNQKRKKDKFFIFKRFL